MSFKQKEGQDSKSNKQQREQINSPNMQMIFLVRYMVNKSFTCSLGTIVSQNSQDKELMYQTKTITSKSQSQKSYKYITKKNTSKRFNQIGSNFLSFKLYCLEFHIFIKSKIRETYDKNILNMYTVLSKVHFSHFCTIVLF